MDPYGLRRVVAPQGVLPQRADVLDPTLPLGEDELAIEVEALNVDAASFRQLEGAGNEGAVVHGTFPLQMTCPGATVDRLAYQ